MTVRLTRFDQFSSYFNEGKVRSVQINPILQHLAGPGNTILTAQVEQIRSPFPNQPFAGQQPPTELHGEVQYDPVTNSISAPLLTNTNEYVCFEMYYKHGESEMHIVKSDEDMRAYCLDQLRSYDFIGTQTGGLHDVALAQYYVMPIDELIQLTLREGNKQIAEDRDWGLMYVVKGQNLVSY